MCVGPLSCTPVAVAEPPSPGDGHHPDGLQRHRAGHHSHCDESAKIRASKKASTGASADDSKAKSKVIREDANKQIRVTSARTTALQAVMQFGAPEPTQIVMKVRAAPLGSKPEDAVADGNVPDPKTRGPWQCYAIDYAADARHIQFVPNSDGTFKVSLEFAVLVYDDQGKLYNSISKVAGADNITAAKKATMLKSGMQFHQEISVPVKGDYYIRAGIHDRVNDAMGAVEMDVNDVKAGAEKAAAALAKAAAGASAAPSTAPKPGASPVTPRL
jgi:hypothetical protein